MLLCGVCSDLLPALLKLQRPLGRLHNNFLQTYQHQVNCEQMCMHSPLNSILQGRQQ